MTCPACGHSLTCPTHGTTLVTYCAHCRASKGGKVVSKAKYLAAQRNLAKARAVRAARKPRPP